MPPAGAPILDEHGVKRSGRYAVTCGVRGSGGIFIVSSGFDYLDPDAADHLAKLLRQHADNERVVETARLICAEAAR